MCIRDRAYSYYEPCVKAEFNSSGGRDKTGEKYYSYPSPNDISVGLYTGTQ